MISQPPSRQIRREHLTVVKFKVERVGVRTRRSRWRPWRRDVVAESVYVTAYWQIEGYPGVDMFTLDDAPRRLRPGEDLSIHFPPVIAEIG